MRIVGLGDSITEGYPYQKKDSWFDIVCQNAGFTYWNMGINGDRTEGMAYRIKEVLAVAPDVVTILGGTNDAFHHLPLATVQKNIKEMIHHLTEALSPPVVIIGLPIPIADRYEESLLTQYRDWMKEYAIRENIPVIDFYAALLDRATGGIQSQYNADGCHPNKTGHMKMAEIATEAITKIRVSKNIKKQ